MPPLKLGLAHQEYQNVAYVSAASRVVKWAADPASIQDGRFEQSKRARQD